MTDATRIPNDDLGEWGEQRFASLCAAASMVANKAGRDKMGWDYIVELPPAGVTAPLDKRPNALRWRLQLKTQWRRDNDTFVMSLSAAERLAKDPGSSAVVLLSVEPGSQDEDPQLLCGYVVHMRDANLERILKRLREAAADPNAASLSDQTITFSGSRDGERFSAAGASLRVELTSLAGTDIDAYIAAKADQLRNAGYEAGRYRAETTFSALSVEDFVEVLLGLRPANLEHMKTADVRFGIPVPLDEPSGVRREILFQPRPADKCTVRFRGAGVSLPATFEAEVILPVLPQVPIEHFRMLVRSRFFKLDLRARGTVVFSFDLPALEEIELDLRAWSNALRLIALLAETEIEVDVEGASEGAPRSSIPLRPDAPRPAEPWVQPLLEAIDHARALTEHAGTDTGPTMLQTLSEQAGDISTAYLRSFAPERLAPFVFTTEDPGLQDADLVGSDFLYADFVRVGAIALGVAVRVTMMPRRDDDQLIWEQGSSQLIRVEAIAPERQGFADFVERQKAKSRLSNALVRELTSGGGEPASD